MRRGLGALLVLVACKAEAVPAGIPPAAPVEAMVLGDEDGFGDEGGFGDDDDGSGAASAGPDLSQYAEVSAKIREAAASSDVAYERLRTLSQRYPARMPGGKTMAGAVKWARKQLQDAGHENVAAEPVKVPGWRRGRESLTLAGKKLDVLGLGGSVPTKGALTAEVVVVDSWQTLEARAADVAGRIVLFDGKLHLDEKTGYPNYGELSPYRRSGPSRAAKLGAKAVLLRSLTTDPKSPPHTGAVDYDEAQPKIPAAAISWPAADAIVEAAAKGPTKVTLRLASTELGEVDSANVVGELRGRERPDEIVVIGGHLDSWDVGQGAQDNGAGVVTAMTALDILRGLEQPPRRTVRVVLWTAEERFGSGAIAYAKAHGSESHFAAMESDSGSAPVMMLSLQTKDTPMGPPGAIGRDAALPLAQLAELLAPDGVRGAMEFFAGADLQPLVKAGVPGVGLLHDPAHYFDVHHSAADVFDAVDAAALRQGVTTFAIAAYVLADLPASID